MMRANLDFFLEAVFRCKIPFLTALSTRVENFRKSFRACSGFLAWISCSKLRARVLSSDLIPRFWMLFFRSDRIRFFAERELGMRSERSTVKILCQ